MGISIRQFEQIKERLNGKASRSAVMPVAQRLRDRGSNQIILGIDPSLRGTGYGVIRLAEPFPEALAHGTIVCPAAWPPSRCLAKISRMLRQMLCDFQPTVCVVEGLFFAQNLKTAILMGAARGAAMATVAEAELDIYEIAPRKVKQAIVGYGAAQKLAVAKMVQRMLNLPAPPAPDAADALALALALANSSRGLSALKII